MRSGGNIACRELPSSDISLKLPFPHPAFGGGDAAAAADDDEGRDDDDAQVFGQT